MYQKILMFRSSLKGEGTGNIAQWWCSSAIHENPISKTTQHIHSQLKTKRESMAACDNDYHLTRAESMAVCTSEFTWPVLGTWQCVPASSPDPCLEHGSMCQRVSPDPCGNQLSLVFLQCVNRKISPVNICIKFQDGYFSFDSQEMSILECLWSSLDCKHKKNINLTQFCFMAPLNFYYSRHRTLEKNSRKCFEWKHSFSVKSYKRH